MIGKISLVLSLLVWLVVMVGFVHCNFFLTSELLSERAIMSPATAWGLLYLLVSAVVAIIAFSVALLALVFQGKSKLIYVSLVLSGIVAVPVSVLLIRQALLKM